MRSASRALSAALALTLGATACSSSPSTPVANSGDRDSRIIGLRSLGAPVVFNEGRDCDAVLGDLQSNAALQLADPFRFGFGSGFGQPMPLGVEADGGSFSADATTAAPAAPSAAATGGDTSETNTQEAGIDEPDLVETNGEHVFLFDNSNGTQGELVVLDGATAEVVGRLALDVWDGQPLLQGDRLLLISSGTGELIAFDVEPGIGAPQPAPTVESSIGIPGFSGGGTTLTLIDVADPTAPTVVETIEVEGHHVDTRVVDGVARVVVGHNPDPLVYDALPFDKDEASIVDAVAAQYEATTIADWLPRFRSTVGDDTVTGTVVECEQIQVPEVFAGIGQTSILRVDFDGGFDPAETTTVVADAGAVYASATNLYLAATKWVPVVEQEQVVNEEWSTAIHVFSLLGDGAATHTAAGEVPGSILNRFALSEWDGHLRVATTEGSPWGRSNDSSSGVHVFAANGDTLDEVGVVDGLGVTETIHAVRFLGPTGYVVTFRRTDPLFVIDLSDHENPTVVGELKIPGFSEYLHPAGEGRLIGIGRDVDEDSGFDRGLQISLFDVADPTDPQRLQTWGVGNSHSAAEYDPHVFLYWAPEQLAAFPFESFGGGFVTPGIPVEPQEPIEEELEPEQAPAQTPAESPDFQQIVGIQVLEITDQGITEVGLVQVDGRYPTRALVVQGKLWSLFHGGVAVSPLDNPSQATFTTFA